MSYVRPSSLVILLLPLLVVAPCCRSAKRSPEKSSSGRASKGRSAGDSDKSGPARLRILRGSRDLQVRLFADRSLLGRAFAKAGYQPPRDAYGLVTRVVPGVGQPAYVYYSLGDTAFTWSRGVFQPASSVKLMASVGALWTLSLQGLDGDTLVTIRHGDVEFRGAVKKLYRQALQFSNNLAYDRLMLIAGFDAMNQDYLSQRNGLGDLAIQQAFFGSTLRHSPPVHFVHGLRSGRLSRRRGVGKRPRCPRDKNCATLLALQEVLRRVALHAEIPPAERFPLKRQDVGRLHDCLRQTRSRVTPGIERVLGQVAALTTVGYVQRFDFLENSLITSSATGSRYLVTLGVPYPEGRSQVKQVEARLAELARQSIRAVKGPWAGGPVLQADAGTEIRIQILDAEVGLLHISAPGADRIQVHAGQLALQATRSGQGYRVQVPRKKGDLLLLVRAFQRGQAVGYLSRIARRAR